MSSNALPVSTSYQVKESVQDVLSRLPDDVTWKDVLYQLYVRAQLDIAMDEARRGEGVSHDEVARRYGITEADLTEE